MTVRFNLDRPNFVGSRNEVEQPCVYTYHERITGRCLYVGVGGVDKVKGKQSRVGMRRPLGDHNMLTKLNQHDWIVATYPQESILAAHVLESKWINEMKPLYNTARVRLEPSNLVRRQENGEFTVVAFDDESATT